VTPDEAITVLAVTSPLPSHPSTRILDTTLASVRYWLPGADVLLLADGVREEQADRRGAYTEALRRHVWNCANTWDRVTPVLGDKHVHQSGLLRLALPMVRTPLVLFVEGDCPIVTDEPIEWDGICAAILDGTVNLVRLHHEAHVLAEHEHLQADPEPICVHGVPLRRTAQYSGRPHIASAAWYRQVMATEFSPEACCFLEDRLHSPVQAAFEREGVPGWALYRLAIYEPRPNAKRSWTLDGREGEPKYDDRQVW